MKFLFLSIGFIFPIFAHANFECKAVKLGNSGLKEAMLDVSPNKTGILTGHATIEDCYFSIQGLIDQNRYALTLRFTNPQPKGSSIFSDAAFDGDGYMRATYVQGSTVYKLICSNRAPL